MTVSRFVLIISLLVPATGALAQVDPDPDGIGIYFDQAATQVTASVASGESITGYLISTNPSQEGALALWEAVVRTPAPEIVIWGTPTSGVNLSTNMPPGGPSFSFVVTPDTPRPSLQSITILGTLEISVLTDDPVGIEVHGYSYELPMYRVDDPFGQDHFLYPSSGSVNLPVAVINGSAPVAVEPQTWGLLKALFR